jgi:hypothetical protein
MSTRSKLNPNIKAARARRAAAVAELSRLTRSFGPNSIGRFRIESLVAAIEDVRKDPRFTSAQKDAKFKALLNRAR